MQNGGNLGYGESTEFTFSVSADGNTPGGFNASFILDITADNNRHGQGSFTTVIGQYSALVLDLDPTNNSAPVIMQSFNETGLIAEYAAALPSDLKNYKSVFVCLGIYYSNHELTEAQALILKDYLEEGGKIYMEGRLTWHTDPQTSLHPMFNITTEEVNWFEYDSIHGIPGTFTEGMTFSYNMTQPYNNHFLHASGPAFEILTTGPDSRAVMVAYDAGDYKTIGSNMEFGGLVDGVSPSTRRELLSGILGFFGDIVTGTENSALEDKSILIKVYPNPFSNQVNFSIHLDETSNVTLDIYDLTGRIISRIIDGKLPAGDHSYSWKALLPDQAKAGGLYFYRFNSGTEFLGGKLILNE
jgi:hypothetical protein